MKTIIIAGLFLIAGISIASAEDTTPKVTKTKELTCLWIPATKTMICTKN